MNGIDAVVQGLDDDLCRAVQHEGVIALAAVEHIHPCAADQRVLAVVTVQRVIAVHPVQQVVAPTAGHYVVQEVANSVHVAATDHQKVFDTDAHAVVGGHFDPVIATRSGQRFLGNVVDVVDAVDIVTRTALHAVGPGAADQRVIARAPEQRVIAGLAIQQVVRGIAGQDIGQTVAAAGHDVHAQAQVFDMVGQGIAADCRPDGIDAAVDRFGHIILAVVDIINIIAQATDHGVIAGATVQHIIAFLAAQHVVAAATREDVMARVANQRVAQAVAGGRQVGGAGQRHVLDVV